MVLLQLALLQQLQQLTMVNAHDDDMYAHNHEGSLKQVHVITRHGSRRILPKNADTLADQETHIQSLLTPLGQQQHYQLGEWLRERYSQFEDFAAKVLQTYDPIRVHVESSSYERTMVSAQSLMLGLFPKSTRGLQLIPETPPVVPIYSQARHNDYVLRAYDKCPVYHDALDTLYDTHTWHQMEFDSMHVLRKLARIPAFHEYVQHFDGEYIPLKDVWNCYDAIQVAITECGTSGNLLNTSAACKELPDPSLATTMDSKDWEEVRALAHAVELLKFSRDVAGKKVGGALLDSICTRMDKYEGSAEQQKMYISSAHYPTLLGLFSAMKLEYHMQDDTKNKKSGSVIPEYASAIILEVHQGDDYWKFYVQMFYKSGTSTDVVPIQLSETCRSDQAGGCALNRFLEEMNSGRLTPDEWCGVCGNVEADACLEKQVEENICMLEKPNGSGKHGGHSNSFVVGIFFLGMISTVLVMYLWNHFVTRRRIVARTNFHGNDFSDFDYDGNDHTQDPAKLEDDLALPPLPPPQQQQQAAAVTNGHRTSMGAVSIEGPNTASA